MHQYLFFIGDFPIRAYGVMLALAIISGASVAYFLLKKDGRGWQEYIVDFSITVAIAGLIGAAYGMYFSSIGITMAIISSKFLSYGKAAWPFKEALYSVH